MKRNAVHNPRGKPVEELPIIYGFNNGGAPGWYDGTLISADGHILGGHVCSSEGFMWGDLGIIEGSRPDRHETFQKHYPDGYRMEFVGFGDVSGHAGLQEAFKLYGERASAPAAEELNPTAG